MVQFQYVFRQISASVGTSGPQSAVAVQCLPSKLELPSTHDPCSNQSVCLDVQMNKARMIRKSRCCRGKGEYWQAEVETIMRVSCSRIVEWYAGPGRWTHRTAAVWPVAFHAFVGTPRSSGRCITGAVRLTQVVVAYQIPPRSDLRCQDSDVHNSENGRNKSVI